MCEKSIICEIKDAILGSKINFITIINKIKEISLCKEKNYWESVQKGCVKIEEIDEKNIEEILSGLIYSLKNEKNQKEELENFSKEIFSKWYGDKKFLKNIKENIQDEENKGIKDKLKELDVLVFGEKKINQISKSEKNPIFFPFDLERIDFENLNEEAKLYFINKIISKKEEYKDFINKKYPNLINIYSFNDETIITLAKNCAKLESDDGILKIEHLAKICNLIYVKTELKYNNLSLVEIRNIIDKLSIYTKNEKDNISDYILLKTISTLNADVENIVDKETKEIEKLIKKLFHMSGEESTTQFLTFEKERNKSFLDVLKEKEKEKEKELKEKELRKKQIDEFKGDDLINKGFTPLSLVAKAEAIERIKNPKNSIEKILIEDLKNAYRYVEFLDEDVSKKFGVQDMMTNYMKIEIERLLDAKLYKKLDYSEDVREKIKTIQDKKDEKLFEINFQE